MSKFTLVAIFCVVNAAFATQAFLGSQKAFESPIFAQLHKIEQSSFGKNILDTIALQVQNQAPLSDISKLLANLKSDLERQQAEADTLQQEREADCEKSIAEYNNRITVAEGIIDETTENIANLETKVAELKASIISLENTIETLNAHLEDIIAEDKAERFAFSNRIIAYDTQLEGLDEIIEMLKVERDESGEPRNEVDVLLQLAKIGKKNPMAAFVQVALALPREQWEKAVNLMTELRGAIAEKKANDQANEAARIARFEEDKANLEANIATNEQKLRETRAELAENEESLAQNRTRLAAAEIELASAQAGLEEKTAQCNKWREDYQRDSKKRNEEIDIITQVQEIFSNRIASAKDYLRERVDQE